MYPKELEKIANFLRNHKTALVSESKAEGRTDSAVNEEIIIKLLKKNGFSVEGMNTDKSDNRSWCDLSVGGRYYVDLKITGLKSADNTASKKQIYYVLTGRNPSKVSDEEGKFFEALKNNMKPNDKDLYYLILGKGAAVGNPFRAFITSLKTVPELRSPSWKNLPFQCDWKKCLNNGVGRSYEESKEFLLKSWSAGIKKAIDKFQGGMPKHFPEYFEERRV